LSDSCSTRRLPPPAQLSCLITIFDGPSSIYVTNGAFLYVCFQRVLRNIHEWRRHFEYWIVNAHAFQSLLHFAQVGDDSNGNRLRTNGVHLLRVDCPHLPQSRGAHLPVHFPKEGTTDRVQNRSWLPDSIKTVSITGGGVLGKKTMFLLEKGNRISVAFCSSA
jgi:hypothetical protein